MHLFPQIHPSNDPVKCPQNVLPPKSFRRPPKLFSKCQYLFPIKGQSITQIVPLDDSIQNCPPKCPLNSPKCPHLSSKLSLHMCHPSSHLCFPRFRCPPCFALSGLLVEGLGSERSGGGAGRGGEEGPEPAPPPRPLPRPYREGGGGAQTQLLHGVQGAGRPGGRAPGGDPIGGARGAGGRGPQSRSSAARPARSSQTRRRPSPAPRLPPPSRPLPYGLGRAPGSRDGLRGRGTAEARPDLLATRRLRQRGPCSQHLQGPDCIRLRLL